MTKQQLRPAPRDRNESARLRVMGVFNTGTFASREAAMRAALAWGWAAHRAGEKLSRLAVLINHSDSIRATLGRVHYWKNVAGQANATATLDVLDAPRADDGLLVLVAGRDGDSSVVVSLAEMKEAANAG